MQPKASLTIAMTAAMLFLAGPLAAQNQAEPPTTQQQGADQGNAIGVEQGQPMEPTWTMTAEAAMSRFDANSDGQLSEGELSVFGATAAGHGTEATTGEKLLEKLDQDSNGAVDQEELKSSDMVKPE